MLIMYTTLWYNLRKAKKMTEKRNMTARLSITPELQEKMRDIARGLDMTYDEAIRFLIYQAMGEEAWENPLVAGANFRQRGAEWKEAQADNAGSGNK
jgi:hypothetical protein